MDSGFGLIWIRVAFALIWLDFGGIWLDFGLDFADFGFHSLGFWAILVPAALTSSLGGLMTRSEVPGLAHCTRDGPPRKFLGVLGGPSEIVGGPRKSHLDLRRSLGGPRKL